MSYLHMNKIFHSWFSLHFLLVLFRKSLLWWKLLCLWTYLCFKYNILCYFILGDKKSIIMQNCLFFLWELKPFVNRLCTICVPFVNHLCTICQHLISISTQRNNVLKLIKDKETKTERGNKYLSIVVNLIFMS